MKTLGAPKQGNSRSLGIAKVRPGGRIAGRIVGGPREIQNQYGRSIAMDLDVRGKTWTVFLPCRLADHVAMVKEGDLVGIIRPDEGPQSPYLLLLPEGGKDEKELASWKTAADFVPRKNGK